MYFQAHFPVSVVDAVFVVGTLLTFILLIKYRVRRNSPHPPGPRPLPIVGNLFHIPRSQAALTWTKLGKQYGPLIWLTVPGQKFLIVDSFEVAKELFERRGSIYVNRPRWIMLRELIGLDYLTQFSSYNADWRKQRAHLKQALSMAVVKKDYSELLEAKTRQYFDHCSAHPEEIVTSLHRAMTEIIIELTYGSLGNGNSADYIQQNSFVADVVLRSMEGYFVELIPVLKYLPSWLPGMGFKRDAARWSKEIEQIRRTAFETVRETALSGESKLPPSYIMNRLRQLHNSGEELKGVKDKAEEEMAIGHTGVETTECSVESLLLAMALFPSVQKNLHAELDKIVGPDRLPTFGDQETMPYLHAVVLETLRWNPIAPFGVPHAPLKDDVYQGYFIPKETTVIVNAWGISRNTGCYTNPSVFDPERFLKPNPELDPREFVFGFGRRICPGNDFAFQSIWILAVTILWGFEITMTEEDAASLREDTDRFTFGFLSRTVPFKCQFIPRQENLKDKSGFSAA